MGSFPDSEGWRTPNSPAFDTTFCAASSADYGSDDRGGARVFAKPLFCPFRRPVLVYSETEKEAQIIRQSSFLKGMKGDPPYHKGVVSSGKPAEPADARETGG